MPRPLFETPIPRLKVLESFIILIETVGQNTKIRDSETSRPKIRESETQRNTRKQNFETHSKRLRDSKIFPRIFRVPFATPSQFCIQFQQWCNFSYNAIENGTLDIKKRNRISSIHILHLALVFDDRFGEN